MQLTSVKTLILSLVLISLLATVIASGLTVAFRIIDYAFSDALSWYQYQRAVNTLPLATSLLLFQFIALLYVSKLVRRDLPRQSGKWHTVCHAIVMCILVGSLAVSVTAGAVLFSGVLGGDVTLRLFLKSLLAGTVGLAIFRHYRGALYPMNRPYSPTEERIITIGVVATVLVLAVASVTIINPFNRPALKQTHETLRDLRNTNSVVANFHKTNGRLPDRLDEALSADMYARPYAKRSMITYEMTGPATYRLCAFFPVPPKKTDLDQYPYAAFPVTAAGDSCFDQSVSVIQ